MIGDVHAVWEITKKDIPTFKQSIWIIIQELDNR